jgi:ABC-2 type transport system ATP-binding protein
MTDGPPMLHVKDVRKVFSTVVAVDGVSFEVRRGEVFGLLGPNGAGKTTTIRMILNILPPDAGSITFDGHPFTDQTRNMVGYLPEERGLYRKSRRLDTILYFAELRGMHRAAAKEEALKWLKRFGLDAQATRKVEELSKGNQQKIQFITTIIHGPTLVILDEPFSGLDPVNQVLFQDIFNEMKQEGKAVIFSTHQMEQAEKLSDSLCLINRGRMVLGGSVREVKKRYGSNSLHVEFEGDGAFMDRLPGVQRAFLYRNAAELDLNEGAVISELIAGINAKVSVRKIEMREPSLHAIFMQTVGATSEAGVEP